MELLFIYSTGIVSSVVLVLLFLKYSGILSSSEDSEKNREASGIENLRKQVYLVVITSSIILFVLLTVVLAGNPLLFLSWAVLIFAAVLLPRRILAKLNGARQLQMRSQIPEVLDMISNSLRAGLTLQQAISRNLSRFPMPAKEEFALVLQDVNLGYSLSQAIDNMEARIGDPDIKMVAIASKIGLEHGSKLAESYALLSHLMRDKTAFESELKAMTAEGRMQALVMTALPFVLLIVMTIIQPQSTKEFLSSTVGTCMFGAMLLMQIVAYFWLRSIMAIKI